VQIEESKVRILNTVRSSVDKSTAITYYINVVDPHNSDADLDPTFHPDADPDQDPSFKKGSNP